MVITGSDLVEPTPLGPCIQLVASSMKERRENAEEAERLRLVALQTARKAANSEAANNKLDQSTPPSKPADQSEVKDEAEDVEEEVDIPVPVSPHVQIFSSEPLYKQQ